ncbi:hypothetical protein FGSG_12111 [Fusarium graminearum PH-1]|uniref:Chromosome 1, complete genome n=1 Tax=Gibberella zeae (strain ATCC MYA-4620 / CBS 123657 / FGSC 9075 / NRRL 31084 / PH-1) TaxID=229533 RepID=I1S5J0_GIBZE|nr:hypothetical protein FGSG_12111 [Fusarium graminearum PH-1]ESU07684.1 hypothetical protein FGSG_12111 [Fusarium graminearum PH-1]EYB31069.1 hypothetical protein FG05_12111 [Fusarium graminearum]CEF74537.1 unnamed protein product [Fusarium graminearum]|eukprot:XP_011318169.1 hypothetical protein FGSG_12111 [Fusarium graminearum PH-1]
MASKATGTPPYTETETRNRDGREKTQKHKKRNRAKISEFSVAQNVTQNRLSLSPPVNEDFSLRPSALVRQRRCRDNPHSPAEGHYPGNDSLQTTPVHMASRPDLAVIGPAVQLQYGAVHAWLGQVWSGQVGPARAQSSLIFPMWLVVDQSHFYPCWNWVGLGQGSGSPTPGSCM